MRQKQIKLDFLSCYPQHMEHINSIQYDYNYTNVKKKRQQEQ